MDDGVLLHKDKDYLKYCLNEIKKILYRYGLELNNKTMIVNVKEGFDFLGFRFLIKNNVIMKIRKQTTIRFKKRIKIINKSLIDKKITYDYYIQVRNSYLGHLSHGSCNSLINTVINNCYKKV